MLCTGPQPPHYFVLETVAFVLPERRCGVERDSCQPQGKHQACHLRLCKGWGEGSPGGDLSLPLAVSLDVQRKRSNVPTMAGQTSWILAPSLTCLFLGERRGPIFKSSKDLIRLSTLYYGFPGGAAAKNPFAKAGDARDVSSIPGSRRSPGEGNDNPLQYSCRYNPKNRRTWRVTVHGVTKSQTRLSN